MRRIIVISSIMLFVLVLGIAMSAPQIQEKASAQSLYEQGYQLYMQAKWNEAITCFDKALAINSTHLLAWCYKGVALNELKRSNEAIAAFDTVLQLDEQCIYALTGKAGVLMKPGRGREGEVKILLAKAVSIQPKANDAFGYLGRGNAYCYHGNYPQAIADYNIALTINPQFADAYNNRGNACAEKKDYKSARRDWGKAVELDPTGSTGQTARDNLQNLRNMGY